MDSSKTKKCSKCGKIKLISHFNKSKSHSNGLYSQCKDCSRKSCGRSQKKYADKINYRYGQLKSSAKKRGLKVQISIEEHENILGNRICYYCDYDFSKDIGSGLNRIDSEKGYTIDNVKPCCGTCNRLMSDISKKELISRLYKIANRLKKGSDE